MIPTDWETGHADVTTRAMRGHVSLRDPEHRTQEWSPTEDQMVSVPAAPYATDLPARVQRLGGQPRDVVAAAVDEVAADYLITVPWATTTVQAGHVVTVLDATDDLLVGRTFTVQHTALGTERFERDLFCTLT